MTTAAYSDSAVLKRIFIKFQHSVINLIRHQTEGILEPDYHITEKCQTKEAKDVNLLSI